MAARYAPSYQFQAADDAGQHVVEVMGNPAGQLTDGFHFLRLAENVFLVPQLSGALFDLMFQRFVEAS
ncbi:hypothetical protein ALP75_204326 [Pseudomonas syringae pv. actinidiae]|nr:hypothetical protein ALP75_204326 [Pseudomonas syringae pv. actinidiae]